MKVPMAPIYESYVPTINNEADSKRGRIFRSSTARAVLAVASLTLLLSSLLGLGSTAGTPNIKDLSDTVTNLARQLQNLGGKNGGKTREVEELEHQLDDTEIELAWEKQHVDDQIEGQKFIRDTMRMQILKDEEIIKASKKMISDTARRTNRAEAKLDEERRENADLKHALASALEELARARLALPAGARDADRMSGEISKSDHDNGRSKLSMKKLRGLYSSRYHRGDSIEIIEYEEGRKVALRPGIIHEINADGTYDLIKLEQSIRVNGYVREQFQSYHVYREGMPALFQEAEEVYVPITIVRFLPCSGSVVIAGIYEFTFDWDERKEIRQGRAIRMHRSAGIGAFIEGVFVQ